MTCHIQIQALADEVPTATPFTEHSLLYASALPTFESSISEEVPSMTSHDLP